MIVITDFWKKFLSGFAAELEGISDGEFMSAWTSSSARTSLYEDRVLGNVAQRMDLGLKKEEFKVDYTLCKEGERGYEVPLVYVESENVATSAHHEIRKLCCLHAPLKVLIVCAEWSDEWSHRGLKKDLLPKWRHQIISHNKEWPAPCITGIIVAEWQEEKLRYYALALDHFGEVVDSEKVFLEREIGG